MSGNASALKHYLPWANDPKLHKVDVFEGIAEAVIEDSTGFLWIGSQGGLYRFDGYDLIHFKSDPLDGSSLSGPWVNSLALEGSKSLWIATMNNGVSMYDFETGKFSRFQHEEQDSQSPPSNTVFDIEVDSFGRIWAASKGGIWRYDPTVNEGMVITLPEKEGEEEVYFYDVYQSQRGEFWFAHSGGISRWDRKLKKLITMPLVDEQGKKWRGSVHCIGESLNGQMWLGTQKHGLARLYGTQLVFYPVVPDSSIHFNQTFVKDMLFTESELWAATYGGGVTVISLDTEEVIRTIAATSSDRDSGVSAMNVLYQDQSESIWLGTFGGLFRFHTNQTSYMQLIPKQNDSRAISFSNARSALERNNGQIWVAYWNNGIDILNADFSLNRYVIPVDFQQEDRNALKIETMLEDEQGRLWLADWGEGLVLYDDESDKFKFITEGLLSTHIGALLVQNDRLWIGTKEGLNYLDLDELEFYDNDKLPINAITAVAGQTEPAKDRIRDFAVLPDQSLWIASTNGVYVLEFGTEELIHIKHDPANEKGLSDNSIFSLLLDQTNQLWLYGSSGHFDRLSKWHQGSAEFESILALYELPLKHRHNPVLSDDGRVWTASGLFDTSKNQFMALSTIDGFDASASWVNSQTRLESGELLFPTTSGLIKVNPDHVDYWSYEPPVVITEVLVDDQKVPTTDFNFLELAPGTKSFRIKFSALDYSDPEENIYAYYLAGQDEDWRYASSAERFASYSNLTPGKYQLKLKGSNRNGDWSSKQISLEVIQAPHFYQTKWFKIIILLCISSGLWGYYRIRIDLLERRQLELQELVNLRTREIEEKNQDLHAIFESMEVAMITICDDNGSIDEQRSLKALTLFGESTDNIFNVLKSTTLSSDERSSIQFAISACLDEDVIGFLGNHDIFPREVIWLKNEEMRSVLEVDWTPIVDSDEVVKKLLVTFKDVTEYRVFKAESEERDLEVATLIEILHNPINNFGHDLETLIALSDSSIKALMRANSNDSSTTDRVRKGGEDWYQVVLRNIHTIKGNARSLHLGQLSELCHEIEDTISKQQLKTTIEFQPLIEDLKSKIDQYRLLFESKLVSIHGQSDNNISAETIEHIVNLIEIHEPNHELLEELKTKIDNKLDRILRPITDELSTIAKQINKPTPRVEYYGNLTIPAYLNSVLKNVMGHLCRNSLDHGIESPAIRRERGKPEVGSIRIDVAIEHNILEIFFQDDGGGLNLTAIKNKAKSNGFHGVDSMNNDQLAELILKPSFSTRDSATEISGRGVGMDAVFNFIIEQGGHLSIDSHHPLLFRITFPLNRSNQG